MRFDHLPVSIWKREISRPDLYPRHSVLSGFLKGNVRPFRPRHDECDNMPVGSGRNWQSSPSRLIYWYCTGHLPKPFKPDLPGLPLRISERRQADGSAPSRERQHPRLTVGYWPSFDDPSCEAIPMSAPDKGPLVVEAWIQFGISTRTPIRTGSIRSGGIGQIG